MSTHCWLCDRPIDDPPRIIGRILAGTTRVAHLECWQYLGEIDLSLDASRVSPHDEARPA